MKLTFIAGPYRASTPWEVEQNIRRAEEVAYKLSKDCNRVAVCPHTMYRFFDKTRDDEYWLDCTKKLLSVCDEILLIDGWRDSVGSIAELDHARSLGLPVLQVVNGFIEGYEG